MKPGTYNRREIFAAALGFSMLPRAVFSDIGPPPPEDLPRVGVLAERALAVIRSRRPVFQCDSASGSMTATADLGAAGRLELRRETTGTLRLVLRCGADELEVLATAAGAQVGRVEARLAESPSSSKPPYDTMRRVPGGYELTFSSPLALRHLAARRIVSELPSAYQRLTAAALASAAL